MSLPVNCAARNAHPAPHRVQRPWGCYEDIDAGDRFRVKRMYQRVKEPAK